MSDEFTQKAREFARRKHEGQLDDEGKPYFDAHVVQVAEIVKLVTNNDPVAGTVAYLHDLLEDTNTTYDELVTNFGRGIADLVMELTHEGKKDDGGYYFPRLQSEIAVLVKIADRLSNLSRMRAWDSDRRKQYVGRSRFWRRRSDLAMHIERSREAVAYFTAQADALKGDHSLARLMLERAGSIDVVCRQAV